jgi:integrase
MPSIRISKSEIDKLTPTGKSALYWDQSLTGFGLKVSSGGAKTYIAQYRTAGGRSGQTRRVTIGKHGSPWTPDSARAEAKRLLGQAAQGEDPAAAKTQFRRMLTVSELCDTYMADGTGTKKASTLAVDRGRIERHIKPLLGKRKVSEITQADIRKFLKNVSEGATASDTKTVTRGRAIVKGGKGTASRTVGLLGGIFTYAIELGLVQANPVHGVKRYPDKKNERFLTAEELGTLGQGLRQAEAQGVNAKALNIIKLLVFTGARRGEIETLRWSEVDTTGRRLRLEDSKTGQKSMPVNSAALDVLLNLQAAADDRKGFVFPATDGDGHYVGTPRIWSILREQIGLHDVRLHDLRHSFASVGVVNGAPLMVVGALLGHADYSTTQRYAHIANDPIAAASERIGLAMLAALSRTDAT